MMKRKNLLLLTLICVLSLVFLCGLLIYAFKIQNKRDLLDSKISNKEEQVVDNTDDNADHAQKEKDLNSETEEQGSEAKEDTISNTDNSSTEEQTNSGIDNDSEYAKEEIKHPNPEDGKEAELNDLQKKPILLGFAGDVNFDENSHPVAKYDREKKGILGGLSADLVEEMKAVDIMMLNNEFAYSTRGKKTPNKSYTFRADPSRVNILHEMGVDIVSLANNHALDYGVDALMDTFTTLEEAGIDYVGAGENLARAEAPVYYTIGDKKIAYLASSRVIFAMDWYAKEDSPGMVGTYDPTPLIKAIEKASENSDFVVVYVHWGVEKNNYPENYQKNFARQYIDAGADIVIGCHPHVMQGFEIYKGKPIAYSLGNFWFNSSTRESGFLKVYIDPDGTINAQIVPVMNKDTYTYIITDGKERQSYFKYMEEISFDIKIDEDGFISRKEG
ncbi:MAG: CapA family protein [Clostridiales bacterium]|nr:CapA family protein [Clostridiales bacterium]